MLFDVGMGNTGQHHLIVFISQEAITLITPRLPTMISPLAKSLILHIGLQCGKGHNWHGTSAGAKTDMFDELLGRVRHDGLVLEEVVADKDTSVNSTFCRHFPEGTVTYCSNHSAKTLHKDLENIKKNPCNVSMLVCNV